MAAQWEKDMVAECEMFPELLRSVQAAVQEMELVRACLSHAGLLVLDGLRVTLEKGLVVHGSAR
ncbi:hypothetical protein FAZ69_23325 [Trinickia terrae]|uniref:Uncharacterized protein n=1 Tax=Trinickia terrae TaxID=2571161 RepID=A0A4U1HWT0_9BURK|nr:hypothetical protein [Trinickia terrae]TKC83426.1 hypothetical protein FAZ69_23325 [Trinickia terrae]